MNGPKAEKDKTESDRTRQKNKRRDTEKWGQTDRSGIPDRGETSPASLKQHTSFYHTKLAPMNMMPIYFFECSVYGDANQSVSVQPLICNWTYM